MEFVNAQIMNMALKGMEKISAGASFEEKMEVAGKLVIALVASDLALNLLKSQNNFIMELLTNRIKNGFNAMIFQKVAMKSMKRDTTFSIGEIVNISQNDTWRISTLGTKTNRLIIAPFEIIFGLVWLAFIVGIKPLAWGIASLVICLCMTTYISKTYLKMRAGYLKAADARGKLLSETFTNIRFIKMCGLENYFLNKNMGVKQTELNWIGKLFFTMIGAETVNEAIPVLFLASIFSSYMYYYGYLSIPTIFLVMQVYNIFEGNFKFLTFIINWMMDIIVSGQRILFFLLSENIEKGYIQKIEAGDGTLELDEEVNAIEIQNGNFYWEDPDLRKLYEKEKNRISQFKQRNKNKKKKGFLCFRRKDKAQDKKKEEPKQEEDSKEERARTLRTQSRFTLSGISTNGKSFASLADDIRKSGLTEAALKSVYSDEGVFQPSPISPRI